MQCSTTRASPISTSMAMTALSIPSAMPVARLGGSLGPKSRFSLAPLRERQRGKSRSGSRRTEELLQRLLGRGLGALDYCEMWLAPRICSFQKLELMVCGFGVSVFLFSLLVGRYCVS